MASRKRTRTAAAATSGIRMASVEEETLENNTNRGDNNYSTVTLVSGFSTTSDVTLRLSLDAFLIDELPNHPPILDLHVSSSALRRSRYFDALLSDRWQPADEDESTVTLIVREPAVPESRKRRPFHGHVSVLRLLHTLDFTSAIRSPTDALDLLPIALEIIFDDLIHHCLRFLDSVPWTEEEESRVLELVPVLQIRESKSLLSRIFPSKSENSDLESSSSSSPSDEMLTRLINSAILSPPNSAAVKNFVAKILRDYPSLESIQKVLDSSFLSILESVKDLIAKYASPDFRIAGDNDEREAMQRINLHAATNKIKHLYWVIERMIEMKVVENAVVEWSEQNVLGSDLQKTLKDENYRNIAPGLPVFLTRCTLRLTGAVVSGHTLVPQQVRMKLVRVWLPVLNACRENSSKSLMSGAHRSIFYELEETFLQMISTLDITDAQDLLQDCLCFSTRNLDECGHLVSAFETWFRRANGSQIPVQIPKPETNSQFLKDLKSRENVDM